MSIADRLGESLGVAVHAVTDLGSSHEWTLHRAELADGRVVFVKAAADRDGVFAAEAAGLRWLGAGNSALVPPVLAAGDGMLVLPWLPDAAPSPAAADRFGRDLAVLHADSPGVFGAPWPGWIAELPLDNTPSEGPWARWYAERRLRPFVSRAADVLGADGVRLLERVMASVEELAGPPEPPARIHGDLWSGNLRWTEAGVVLIDPAAHGGHRETDLAMLALFGALHLDRVVAAYERTRPLAAGWRSRVALHQLHPLLVHVALFGAGYRARTLAAARAALAA
ncbi:fructosamine kinase family protein [Nocardia amikacinitolerans]|uniref:fructosamine kinase family protein n=1 Tax=Nocardia amikacinitolerans TaxID=756689 RepID=UPI0036971776